MILITWCSFRERQTQKWVQRRCLTLNCRSRALPEVPVLCSLLPIGHPIPFISSSKPGAALWCVLNAHTSFWVCFFFFAWCCWVLLVPWGASARCCCGVMDPPCATAAHFNPVACRGEEFLELCFHRGSSAWAGSWQLSMIICWTFFL